MSIESEETGNRPVKDIIKGGKIAVQYCGGQTTLWIPKRYCEELGASRLLEYAKRIFSYERLRESVGDIVTDLEEWILSVNIPELSAYEIEFPSVTRLRIGEVPVIDPENKISRLIKLIDEGLKE